MQVCQLLAAARPLEAVDHHAAALRIATDIGVPDQQARAHTGLGHAHSTLGDLTRGREHYEHALTLHTHLEPPEARDIRAKLTSFPPRQAAGEPG